MAVLHPFPHYAGFTDYTPTLPALYWDVYSSEQRIKALCMEYVKLIGFTDSIVDTVNSQYELIEDMQAKFPQLINEEVRKELNRMVEEGILLPIVQHAIDVWMDERSAQVDENTAHIHNIETEYVKCYETVAKMKIDPSAHVGMVVKTNGFNEPGDNGAAFYVFSETGTPNGMDVIECQNQLNAILVKNGPIVPEMLGAYANGSTDCSDIIKHQLSNYANVSFSNGAVYLISSTLEIATHRDIDFNGCTFVYDGQEDAISLCAENTHLTNGNIANAYVKCTRDATCAIRLKDVGGEQAKWSVSNISIQLKNAGTGIIVEKGYENAFSNIRFETDTNREMLAGSVAIDVRGTDNSFRGIYGVNYQTFIKYSAGSNLFEDVHAWISPNKNAIGSIFIDARSASVCKFVDVYADTYQKAVNIAHFSAIVIDGIKVFQNGNIDNSYLVFYEGEYFDRDLCAKIDNVAILWAFDTTKFSISNRQPVDTCYLGFDESYIYDVLTTNAHKQLIQQYDGKDLGITSTDSDVVIGSASAMRIKGDFLYVTIDFTGNGSGTKHFTAQSKGCLPILNAQYLSGYSSAGPMWQDFSSKQIMGAFVGIADNRKIRVDCYDTKAYNNLNFSIPVVYGAVL